MIELFPYQKEGIKWLAQQRFALLADEMGLGKSAQAVKACDLVKAERVLVICPAVARQNWIREFQKFSSVSRLLTAITKKSALASVKNSQNSVVLSYDLAHSSLADLNGPWDCLILDEAHYLKSIDAKRTKAVLGKDGLIHKAKRTWALSGTPTPNHPAELWPLLYTFGVTKLRYEQFVDRYCTFYEAQHGRQITGARTGNIPELRQLISNVMLRRRKSEVMQELPPIFYSDVVVEAGLVDIGIEASFAHYIFPVDKTKELFQELDQQRSLVKSMVDTAGLGKDGMAALAAMAQSVSTLRRYVGLQKVQPVVDMITEELETGAYEKVVLFAVHRDVIEGLRAKLSKFKPVTIYGGTDPERRTRNIDKFQNNPKCKIFIGNIQAAGTAITLTAAHNVIFVEQDWVPGNNAQAAMRCHRIGQKNTVFVRFVGLADSIDEKVAQVLKRKTRDITAIFDERQLPSVKPDDTTYPTLK